MGPSRRQRSESPPRLQEEERWGNHADRSQVGSWVGTRKDLEAQAREASWNGGLVTGSKVWRAHLGEGRGGTGGQIEQAESRPEGMLAWES